MLETQRLHIRRYTTADVAQLGSILTDAQTMRYWPHPLSADEVRAWIDRSLQHYTQYGYGRYALILKSTGMLIGDCGILRTSIADEELYDLGYIIHHPYWGQGYALEAAQALKQYAFATLHLPALHANMPWNHAASRRVAEQLGMHQVKQLHNPRNRDILTLLYTVANTSTSQPTNHE